MPTYSYACTACDHRFDIRQGFADAALAECPQCGGRLRKVFGDVGVMFKGSGFYRTDARKERAKAAAGREPRTRKAGGSKSDGGAGGSKSDGGASGSKSDGGASGSKSGDGAGGSKSGDASAPTPGQKPSAPTKPTERAAARD